MDENGKEQEKEADLSKIESVNRGWIIFNEKHSRIYCDLKRVELKKKCWNREKRVECKSFGEELDGKMSLR